MKQKMPADNYLYEYAVIRYVPRVEREEFINVGLIMMCKSSRWLRVALDVQERRLSVFDSELSCDEIRRQLSLFSGVGNGDSAYGPIAGLEPEERFRW